MVTGSGVDVKGLISQYVFAKYVYHSGDGESPLTDEEFDTLEKHLIELKVCSPDFFQQVGTAVQETRDAVSLPEPMGSLEKVRTDEEISKWLYQSLPHGDYPLCVMAKVDGLSVELVYENGLLTAAYTRGDGLEGTLITRHLFLVPDVPHKIPVTNRTWVIRGELYMPEALFEEYYAKKYANARNFVAGVTRRKKPTIEDLRHMRLAAYHIYGEPYSKVEMFDNLDLCGFTTPLLSVLSKAELTQASLTKIYHYVAENAEYRIDGLVIEVDGAPLRKKIGFETNSLNPAYGRAFKVDLTSNIVHATVEEVDWAVSKDGYLKPRLVVSPIQIGGVTVRHVTVYNAKYVIDNGLGPGAKVAIIRSGDVIPKVVEVLQKVQPQLPDIVALGPYEFGETGVDLILTGESSTQKLEKLVFFFQTMQIENISSGILKKFFDKGFEKPEQILAMLPEDMIKNIDGVKKASAERLVKSIREATSEVSLPVLMAATGAFGRGFGESRSEILFNHFKGDIFQLLTWPTDILMSEICLINGFSDTTAELFVNGLPLFKERFDALSPYLTIKPYQVETPVRDVFQGVPFVFSGVRSDEMEAQIISLGGTIGSSVSSKTKYLIVKDKSSTSAKVEKARSLGVQIFDLNELATLIAQYL